jgi:hypothetical protein
LIQDADSQDAERIRQGRRMKGFGPIHRNPMSI